MPYKHGSPDPSLRWCFLKTLISERYLWELDYSGKKGWTHVHIIRFHLEGAILDRQGRNVESVANHVVDQDAALAISFLSSSFVITAVCGSLITRNTFKPEMDQVSLVAWRCESLKWADTVTTAWFILFHSYASLISFVLVSTTEETSSGSFAVDEPLCVVFDQVIDVRESGIT